MRTPIKQDRLIKNYHLNIKRAYKNGDSMQKIANRYRVSVGTIHQVLIRLNIPRRPKGPQGVDNTKKIAKIIKLRAMGQSYQKISTTMGVSRQRVYDLMKLHRRAA